MASDIVKVATMTFRGLLHWLTFTLVPTSNTAAYEERSLGKIVYSLLCFLIVTINARKTFKNGAMSHSVQWWLLISMLCQVGAKIVSIFFLIQATGHLWPALLVSLIHVLWVLLIKALLEQTRSQPSCFPTSFATLGNAMASNFIYVRIPDTPDRKPKISPTPDEHRNVEGGDNIELNGTRQPFLNVERRRERSSLVEQSVFFAFSFMENVIMLAVAYAFNHISPYSFVFVSTCSVIAWFCHYGFYALSGHPWALTNGPILDRDTGKLTINARLFRKRFSPSIKSCFKS